MQKANTLLQSPWGIDRHGKTSELRSFRFVQEALIADCSLGYPPFSLHTTLVLHFVDYT
jgi:hypothetical protein